MTREELRSIIKVAKQLTGMLQGTIGLEGQELRPKELREIKRQNIIDLIRQKRAFK